MVGISATRKERGLELSLYACDEIQCMEKGSSPKVLDDSLGSDGASPFTNTSSSSTSEDSSCGELSPEKLWGPTPVSDASTESPLGSDKHSSPIARLMERTGYSIVQQNGQRRYGPPPDWEGEAPSRGCEVFVGKIPRDCFEDELVPVFDRMGKIYELRLMMDYTGLNRGYAFVVYGDVASAKESVRQLNNYEIRKGRTLGVCMSVDNCRLFVGGIPKKVTKEDIKHEVQKVTEGVVDVIVYPSAADKTKNRGFAFVEYDSHRAAAMARRKLMNGRVFLWGHQLAVDWAEPELEVDEEIMAQVKVLYIRNLMLTTTESTIEEVFSRLAPVERVKKIRDYAFVHFHSKEDAHKAMNALNGSLLDGAEIEVMLAKPVNKDTYSRSPKFNRMASLPAVSFIPVDNYGTILPAFYPNSYPIPPKYMVRNSMGTCTMVRMMYGSRTGRGGRSFLPLQMVQPNQRVVMPTPFFATPQGCFDTKQSEDPLPAATGYTEIQTAPPSNLPPVATVTQGIIIPKPPKNVVQFLEEVCAKNSWPSPLYTLHTSTSCGSSDTRLFVYKVTLTSVGVSYMPRKLSRTMEEARSAAAEYTLSQLGYCSEMPVAANSYPAIVTQSLSLGDTSAGYTAPPLPTAYSPHPTAKPASWGAPADPTGPPTAVFTPAAYPADPYLSQQMYGSPVTAAAAAHQEIYPQPLHHPATAPSHGF